MRKLFFTGSLILSSTLLLAGCEQISSSSTANHPAESATTDAQLKDQVQSRLNSEPQLKQADLDVQADASKNEVTLSGIVESEALRSKAVDLAKAAHDGVTVVDKIDVKPQEVSRSSYTKEQAQAERERGKSGGDNIGNSLDDAWIHMKIVAQLIGNSKTPERKINVDVVDKNVTLRGTVDTQVQKAEAERVARSTDGVKSVQNMLKVATKGKSV